MKHIDTLEGLDQFPADPPHPENLGWAHVLAGGTTIVWADSATEALGGLIGGTYDHAIHTEQLAARCEIAVVFAGQLQTDAVIDTPDSVDLGAQPSDVIGALTANRRIPFRGVRRPDGRLTHQWDSPIPLVLIDTHYMPLTDRPQPDGNIIWILASTEADLLTSLHDAGAIHYQTRSQEEAA